MSTSKNIHERCMLMLSGSYSNSIKYLFYRSCIIACKSLHDHTLLHPLFSLLSYERLSRKPLLFKSFTGLTQQFDDIYDKEITKRYAKHEIQRLSSKRKKDMERDRGAGRPFKLELENRFLMLLAYYRLYITYALAGFLFDLNQSTICRHSKD